MFHKPEKKRLVEEQSEIANLRRQVEKLELEKDKSSWKNRDLLGGLRGLASKISPSLVSTKKSDVNADMKDGGDDMKTEKDPTDFMIDVTDKVAVEPRFDEYSRAKRIVKPKSKKEKVCNVAFNLP